MCNEKVKQVMAEKRRMTLGQITDGLVSGELRREMKLSKEDFSRLVGVVRGTVRRVEGLEIMPSMKMVMNTAAAFRVGIDFPECGEVEVVPRRVKK